LVKDLPVSRLGRRVPASSSAARLLSSSIKEGTL
jgi:hypothetical protein